jgi:hypothetical protein
MASRCECCSIARQSRPLRCAFRSWTHSDRLANRGGPPRNSPEKQAFATRTFGTEIKGTPMKATSRVAIAHRLKCYREICRNTASSDAAILFETLPPLGRKGFHIASPLSRNARSATHQGTFRVTPKSSEMGWLGR